VLTKIGMPIFVHVHIVDIHVAGDVGNARDVVRIELLVILARKQAVLVTVQLEHRSNPHRLRTYVQSHATRNRAREIRHAAVRPHTHHEQDAGLIRRSADRGVLLAQPRAEQARGVELEFGPLHWGHRCSLWNVPDRAKPNVGIMPDTPHQRMLRDSRAKQSLTRLGKFARLAEHCSRRPASREIRTSLCSKKKPRHEAAA
jgi:hypothetical protein